MAVTSTTNAPPLNVVALASAAGASAASSVAALPLPSPAAAGTDLAMADFHNSAMMNPASLLPMLPIQAGNEKGDLTKAIRDLIGQDKANGTDPGSDPLVAALEQKLGQLDVQQPAPQAGGPIGPVLAPQPGIDSGVSTPQSGASTPQSGVSTPQSGVSTPQSGIATPQGDDPVARGTQEIADGKNLEQQAKQLAASGDLSGALAMMKEAFKEIKDGKALQQGGQMSQIQALEQQINAMLGQSGTDSSSPLQGLGNSGSIGNSGSNSGPFDVTAQPLSEFMTASNSIVAQFKQHLQQDMENLTSQSDS